MKKITKLLMVLSLAFFAAACSESPTAVQLDDPALSGAEARSGSWSGSWGGTHTKDPNKPSKTKLPNVERSSSGYALGM